MDDVHQVTTLTSKGQITLPKPIRQALGVTVGSKIAFALREGEVVVRRVEEVDTHEDPAIGAFLTLLERDISAGGHVRAVPDKLAKAMTAAARRARRLEEAIEGKVAL